MKVVLLNFVYPAAIACLTAGLAFALNYSCVVEPDRQVAQEEIQKQELRNEISGLDAWLAEAGNLIAIRRSRGEYTDLLEAKLKNAWDTRNKADKALRNENLDEAKILVGIAYDSLRPDEVRTQQ